MNALHTILRELIGLFVDDELLAMGILAAVAIFALLIVVLGLDPIVSGVTLLLGNVAVLIAGVLRTARR